MYAKKLIENNGIELGDLVQAFCLEVRTVDVFPKTVVFYLVEPAGEIGYKAGFCGRVV